MTSITDIARTCIPGYDPWRDSDGWEFDEERADKAVRFFERWLIIPDGPKAGQPLVISDYQKAITANIRGWIRKGDTSKFPERRYRECMLYVPRKNSKSCWAAGEVCQELACNPLAGGQFFSIAADRAQAAIIFDDAAQMIRQGPLNGKFEVRDSYKTIERPRDRTRYKALSSEAPTKHGLRPAFVIVDELHSFPNSELLDALMTGTAVVGLQPIVIHTTTADFERESVCNSKREYAVAVRDGVVKDPRFLPVIYECNVEADWTDPRIWAAVNPNLGVTVSEDYLKRACERARNEPSFLNEFKRLHLNIKTQSVEAWLPMDKWDLCPSTLPFLDGAECYGGLDMSSTQDVTAFVLWFPEHHACKCWFWLPGDNADIRYRKSGVPYPTWVREGYITETPGNYIEHDDIYAAIVEASNQYTIRKIGFDGVQAASMAVRLQEHGGEEWVERIPQSKITMTSPCKSLERMIGDRELNHGGNPVLRWMAGNTVVEREPNRSLMIPSKKISSEKIDGIAALCMAIGTCEADDAEHEWYKPGSLAL